MERYGCAVQLASAVVRQQNTVHTQIGKFLGVLNILHALNDDLAGPDAADFFQVLIVNGGVHRRVQQLAHGTAG